jgi:hypothetical protein
MARTGTEKQVQQAAGGAAPQDAGQLPQLGLDELIQLNAAKLKQTPSAGVQCAVTLCAATLRNVNDVHRMRCQKHQLPQPCLNSSASRFA